MQSPYLEALESAEGAVVGFLTTAAPVIGVIAVAYTALWWIKHVIVRWLTA